MSSHARLSPSNTRWFYCAGSVREEAVYPDISSDAAIDGTGSHLLLELCLLNDVPAHHYQGKILRADGKRWLVRPDRVKRVQECLEYISRRVNELKDMTVVVEAETRSDPGKFAGRDDWHGTCDVCIRGYKNEQLVYVEVIDYKDGRGFVSEKDNTQLLNYLIGKGYLTEATEFRVTILQPKTKPAVRHQDLNAHDVEAWFARLAAAADATDDPNAPLVAGKHCLWCKHKKNCIVRGDISLSFLNLNMEEATDDQLEKIMDEKKLIIEKITAAEEEIKRRGGTRTWKFLDGNANYKYTQPEAKLNALFESFGFKPSEYTETKLYSPAKARKLLLTEEQKEKLEEVIKNEPSKTLKKVSAKSAKQIFAEELL